MIQPLSGNVKINRFTDNRLILGLLLIVLLLLTAIVDDKFDKPKVVEFYDGLKTHVVKTYENDVDSFLRSQNISLSKSDILLNSLSDLLVDSMEIRLIKVSEEITIEEETINFKQLVISSNYIPRDVFYELRPGRQGLKKNYYKLTRQNSIQKSRQLLGEVICEKPVDRIILCPAGYSREAAGASAGLLSVNITLSNDLQAGWNDALGDNGAMLGIALFPAGIIGENSIIEIESYGRFIVKNEARKNSEPNALKAAQPSTATLNIRLVMPGEMSKNLSARKKNARVKLI
jgi:hypothetical protein